MNERVMQFRIGLSVIAAGMVLTMLIVWFEAPVLMRERRYVTAFFREAPGVDRGIPVRKSGVRVGEVFAFEFTRPEQPEGVLVTLSLDPSYTIRAGTIPKLGRALLGDTAIDLIPGEGDHRGLLPTYDSPAEAIAEDRWVLGLTATDPFGLLSDASKIFERADETLVAIQHAADGLGAVVGKAEAVEEFLDTWSQTGRSIDRAATELERVIVENEAEITPAVAGIRRVAEKLDAALGETSADQVRQTLDRASSVADRLDALLVELEPVVKDLRAGPRDRPTTNVGQTLMRANRIAYDLSVLTGQIHDGNGRINPNGSLQRLISDPQLYDDFRVLVRAADATLNDARGVLRTLNVFAEKISRNPSLISEGVLNPR